MRGNLETGFPTIVAAILRGTKPSTDEIRTILRVAYLTAEIDLDEDSDEMALLRFMSKHLWELTGHPTEPMPIVSPLPLPIDDEARRADIRELAQQLGTSEARELAYAVAYLFAIADLTFVPVESTFLEELRGELRIEPSRAEALVAVIAEIVTPGVGSTP